MKTGTEPTPEVRTVTVAHSPDSDDAFMFYGLATNKLETEGIKFEHTLKDIQSLNEDAKNGVFDVTAISFHAYAYVSDKYALLPHGASIGDKYGPILVAKEPRGVDEIGGMKIAIPGELTSAFLALRLYNSEFQYEVRPFDQITDAVLKGEVDAGLLIHEGQLFYKELGLDKVLDLGEWWFERTGLPLPMGGNAIKRDLGEDLMKQVSRHLHSSIMCACQRLQDAVPDAGPSPANETIVASGAGAIDGWEVPPGSSRSQHTEDSIEDAPIIDAGYSARLCR